MMRPSLGVGLDHHGARPQLARSGSSVSDGRRARHAGSLRRVGIEFAGGDDLDAVMFPVHAHLFTTGNAVIRNRAAP